MSDAMAKLVQTAGQLANAGRLEEAERAWREVRRLEPRNPQALFSLGIHALKRNDLPAAVELLRAAKAAAPTDLPILMTLCAACRQQGDQYRQGASCDHAGRVPHSGVGVKQQVA